MSERVTEADFVCEDCHVRRPTEMHDDGTELCARCTLDRAFAGLTDAGKAALAATPSAAGEPNDHAACATMDDVVREVFCRLFGDDGDAGMAEMERWRAWYKPSDWFWWGRALGAFLALRVKERASSGATREGA